MRDAVVACVAVGKGRSKAVFKRRAEVATVAKRLAVVRALRVKGVAIGAMDAVIDVRSAHLQQLLWRSCSSALQQYHPVMVVAPHPREGRVTFMSSSLLYRRRLLLRHRRRAQAQLPWKSACNHSKADGHAAPFAVAVARAVAAASRSDCVRCSSSCSCTYCQCVCRAISSYDGWKVVVRIRRSTGSGSSSLHD